MVSPRSGGSDPEPAAGKVSPAYAERDVLKGGAAYGLEHGTYLYNLWSEGLWWADEPGRRL